MLTDDSVVKLLWLALCDIEDKRARECEKERGKPGKRKASGRPVEGQVTTNWKQVLAQLAGYGLPDRINRYLYSRTQAISVPRGGLVQEALA